MSGTVVSWIAIAVALPVLAAVIFLYRTRVEARRARGPAELGDALRRARERAPENRVHGVGDETKGPPNGREDSNGRH